MLQRRDFQLISAWVVAFATILSSLAWATQVQYRSLQEILDRGTPVIRARVMSVREETTPGTLSVYVDIDQVEVLRGEVAVQPTLCHSFSTLLERPGAHGSTVRVSPIRDGSGIERDLQPGETYTMILDQGGGQLVRAEQIRCPRKG